MGLVYNEGAFSTYYADLRGGERRLTVNPGPVVCGPAFHLTPERWAEMRRDDRTFRFQGQPDRTDVP